MADVASMAGIDMSGFRSTAVDEELLASSDIIFVMERSHYEHVRRISPASLSRTFLLGAHSESDRLSPVIEDPYGMSRGDYQRCFERVVIATDHVRRIVTQAEAAIRRRFSVLSERGYRVLGVARKALAQDAAVTLADESAMTFVGFLSFRDPAKPGIARALRELGGLGISLCMVTGDNRLVAAHVARAVGLDARRVLTGEDLRGMSDEESQVMNARLVLLLANHVGTRAVLEDALKRARDSVIEDRHE